MNNFKFIEGNYYSGTYVDLNLDGLLDENDLMIDKEVDCKLSSIVLSKNANLTQEQKINKIQNLIGFERVSIKPFQYALYSESPNTETKINSLRFFDDKYEYKEILSIFVLKLFVFKTNKNTLIEAENTHKVNKLLTSIGIENIK